jgi:hypothetical protein
MDDSTKVMLVRNFDGTARNVVNHMGTLYDLAVNNHRVSARWLLAELLGREPTEDEVDRATGE